jgi:tetratricopeptide (TPR) repeat protein
MPRIIVCPSCHAKLKLPEEIDPQMLRCPLCQTDFSADAPAMADSLIQAEPSPQLDVPVPFDTTRPRAMPDRLDVSLRRKGRSPAKVFAIVLALVALFLLVVGSGVFGIVLLVFNNRASREPAVALAPQDDKERQRDVREAMAGDKPLLNQDIAPELKKLFDALGAAFRATDQEALISCFDPERMYDELRSRSVLPLFHPWERGNVVGGLRRGLGTSLVKRSRLLEYTSFEIRQVKQLRADEVVVIVRHAHPAGATLKMRWWLVRRGDGWKVYDLEDLDIGIPFSSLSATLIQQGDAKLADSSRAATLLGEAVQSIAIQQDVDGVEKKLGQIARLQLPRELEAMRFMVKAMICQHRGQHKEAVAAVAKARTFRQDLPILDFLQGVALSRLGQWQEGLKHLEAYRALLGDDAIVCREIGQALRNSKKFVEAEKAYRKSLDLNPTDADAFQGFLLALGGDSDKSDVGARFLKLTHLRENFDIFAADCERREFPQLLEPLALAMRKVDPDYPSVDFYLCLVKARSGQPAQAAALFKSGLSKQLDHALRRTYGDQFLKAMASTGKLVAAYQVAPERREAFRFLAAEALKRYLLDELKQLLRAHRKADAADHLLGIYQAEVYVRQWRYGLAEKSFAAALVNPPNRAELVPFRSSRVLSLYHVGKAMDAYRDVGPRDETFRQLAGLAVQDGDAALLQALIDIHAKNDPQSIDLLSYTMHLKVMQGRVAEGAELLRAAQGKQSSEEKRADLVSEFLTAVAAAGKAVEGYQATPNATEAFGILAEDLLDEGRFADLRQLIAAHVQRDPADPLLALYQGEIYLNEQAWDKAVAAFKTGMKTAPKNLRDRFPWKIQFAMYKAGLALQAYRESDTKHAAFTQLADLLQQDKKAVELETLIDAHKANAADDPDVSFYKALALILKKQPAMATHSFQQAYSQQKEQAQRGLYVRRFVLAMEDCGQGIEAYRAVPDKSSAFVVLAPQLVSKKKEKVLAALLEEHRKGDFEHTWYEFYLGELHLLCGEAAKAEPHFVAALAKSSPQDQWRLRDGLLRARIKAGKAAIAYQEAGLESAMFEDLASRCVQEKDAQQLQALIDAHRKALPEEAEAAPWQLELLWLKKDYEEILKLLADDREEAFAQPRWRWKADDYRIRSLVRLKRTEDALKQVRATRTKSTANQTPLILAYAAAGQVKDAIAVVEKHPDQLYLLRGYYDDPDLGPILTSEPFRAFREKFPEPKTPARQGNVEIPAS